MPISIDTSAITGLKPAPQTSLSDVLGMAGKALEVQKMSELYPAIIQKAETEAAQAKMKFDVEKASEIAKGQVGLLVDDLVLKAKNSQLSADEKNILMDRVIRNAQLQSKNAGIPWEKEGIKLAAEYINVARDNPEKLYEFLMKRHIAGLDSVSRSAFVAPSIETVDGKPVFVNRATQTITSPTFPGQTSIPSERGQTPAIGAAAPSAGAGEPSAQPKGVVPPDMAQPPQKPAEQTAIVPLKWPVRRPDIPFSSSPEEKTDLVSGTKYRDDLIKASGNFAKSYDDVRHVLKSVDKIQESLKGDWPGGDWSTGARGYAARKWHTLLGTDTGDEIKELTKSLAAVAISNKMALGESLNNVDGQQLVRAANGDETFPPSVLRSIARRTMADITNLELQTQAADKFSSMYGDNNLPRFRLEWNKNSDKRIFEHINLDRESLSPEKRSEALKRIYEKTSDAEYDKLIQKYRAIKNMVEGKF